MLPKYDSIFFFTHFFLHIIFLCETLYHLLIIMESVECCYDDDIFFSCDDIVLSTSLENKCNVFTEIENQLRTSSSSSMLEELGNKCTYNKVLRQLMIYSLHKKYINRIYKSVMYQLIHERRMREYSHFYHTLITP
jgi:hypothetical protein